MIYIGLKCTHLVLYRAGWLFLLCFFLTSTFAKAQSAVVANGIDVANEYGIVAASIGSVFYTSRTKLLIISEGLQHSMDVNKIKRTEQIKLFIFPNPTSGYIFFKVEDVNYENLHYKVYNIIGNLMRTGRITDNHSFISMIHLPNALYIVSVFRGEQEIQTFKIIKSN